MPSQYSDNRCVLYGRFSPRPNPEESASLSVQDSRNRVYCESAGLVVVSVFADPEVSARKVKLAKREGGAAMLAFIEKEKIRHVVALNISRIFRNLADGSYWLERWTKKKVALHLSESQADASTPSGFLTVGVQLLMSAYEPMVTAQRTSLAMRHRQANGERMSGRLPFGKTLADGKLVDAPEQLAVIQRMRELEAEIGYHPNEIARRLRAEGFTSADGGDIHHTLVMRRLKA